jgi:hypothetical protein
VRSQAGIPEQKQHETPEGIEKAGELEYWMRGRKQYEVAGVVEESNS